MKKNSLITMLLCLPACVFGQMSEYNYKRELSGIKEQWHRIELPDDFFEKADPSLNAIRIYGITPDNDTVEAPFLPQIRREESRIQELRFELVNSVHNANGHYYTLKVKEEQVINEIDLNFGSTNYDWRIKLEGSNNQNEWFTIVENSRILSIQNEHTNYSYNRLHFPNSLYRYYRIHIPTDNDPALQITSTFCTVLTPGETKAYDLVKQVIEEQKDEKQTVIFIRLKHTVPVSHIHIDTRTNFDFYRPILIESLEDSTKTEKGYLYSYREIARGTLSSLENNTFHIADIPAKNLRITIFNYDSEPLSIEHIEVRGHVHELVARFTKPGRYFLVYGHPNPTKPIYDIDHFRETIPSKLIKLTLGNEQAIASNTTASQNKEPFFQSSLWIWGIMGLIIVVLGWFTLKMMRSANERPE